MGKSPLCTRRGINSDATADIAMLLMLGASRRAYEGQEMVRAGKWTLSSQMLLGWQLKPERFLAFLGMGRVGQAVAQRARGFGMQIHYFNPTRLPPALEKGAVFHSTCVGLTSRERVSYSSGPGRLRTPDEPHQLPTPKQSIYCRPDAPLINAARGGMIVGGGGGGGRDELPGYVAQLKKHISRLPHMGKDATVETRCGNGHACPGQHRCGSGWQACASLVTRRRFSCLSHCHRK